MKRKGFSVLVAAIVLAMGAPVSATHEVENRYLENLTPLSGSVKSGTYSVAGQAFSNSVAIEGACSTRRAVEYKLGRAWERFLTTVGLDDVTSDQNASGTLEVLRDGQAAFSREVFRGQSFAIDLEVAGVDRLTIAYTPSCVDPNALGVFGSAALRRPKAHSHSRSVSLKMSAPIKASGVVSVPDGTTECAASVKVKIQRASGSRWKTVASTTTNASGAYSVRAGSKHGKFRAIAPAFTIGQPYPEHLCAKGQSKAVRF